MVEIIARSALSSPVNVLHFFCWPFIDRNITFKKCLNAFLHYKMSFYTYS